MKGLARIPTSSDRVKAYNKLQSNELLKPHKLALYLCWARLDPRLAEILVAYFAKHWRAIDPVAANVESRKSVWPAVTGVLLDHAELLISKSELASFKFWKKIFTLGIKPAAGEIFWLGVLNFGGRQSRSLYESSSKAYLRWGFYGNDILVNKANSKKWTKTLLPKATRMKALRVLAGGLRYFSLHDYLEALEGKVQKRTAELDLVSAKFLIAYGNTKGRVYRGR